MSTKPGQRFTPEEIKIIMTCNHRKSCRLLPHRSPGVIAGTRHALKYNFKGKRVEGKSPRYTAEQIEILRENFPKMKMLDLRNKFFPDRSVGTLQRKATSLGLSRQNQHAPSLDGNTEIIHQIITAASERGIPAYRLDQLCETRQYFRTGWRHYPLNLIAVARGVEFLGGRLLADFSFQPFGAESKRLLACLDRFMGAPAPVIKAKPSKVVKPRRDLAYPFARAADPGNKLVLAVNELVPHNMPGREDVCQTILLAVLENTITLDQLQANRDKIRPFITGFMKANYEARGHAVSIDEPLKDGVRLIDKLAAPQ